MSKSAPTMPCPVCEGSGRAPLPQPLADAFTAFRARLKLSAADVQKALPFGETSINAVNNRLERLRSFGMLIREKQGRTFFYSLPPKAKPAVPAAEGSPG